MYLRYIFPEDCFADETQFDVPVKRLSSSAPNESAQQMAKFIDEGLVHAIENDTISGVDVLISTESKGPVIERYSLVLSEKGLALEGAGEPLRDPTKSVRILLRKLLITTDALGPLPDNSVISLRLHYHDHVPPEYEPRWFQTGGSELKFAADNIIPLDLNLGTVPSEKVQLSVFFQARPEQIKENEDDDGDDMDDDDDDDDDDDENGDSGSGNNGSKSHVLECDNDKAEEQAQPKTKKTRTK